MKWVDEISVLRSIACLSIVFLHAIKHGLPEIGSPFIYTFYNSLYLLLYFGTPLFIFISEFLLAYAYKGKGLPENFLRKRIRYILVPYAVMALFYAIPYAQTWESFQLKLLMNVLIGDFHGYFILIIFQFYVLHLWLHKHLARLSRKQMLAVLAGALAVNAGYLAFFNLTAPAPHPIAEYVWERFFWVPFPGWIFYFFLGYFGGVNYQALLAFIQRQRHKYLIYLVPIGTSVILLCSYYAGWITEHSSKRMDILLHSVAVGILILYWAGRLKKVPVFLERVSRYSFGIYLLHIFYISVLETINPFDIQSLEILYIPCLFAAGISGAMATTWVLSKWKYGGYVIGKVRAGRSSSHWKMYDFFPIHTFYIAMKQKIKKE